MLSEAGAPRYFNGTFDFNAYNATTMATVTGAILFIALNTAFVALFTNPQAKAKKSSKNKAAENTEVEYQYAYYDYDQGTQR